MSVTVRSKKLTIGKMINVGQNCFMYRFDFKQNFFSRPDAELTERDRYYLKLDEFDHLRGKLAASAHNLLQGIRLYEIILVEFTRHYTYHLENKVRLLKDEYSIE